jgi:hypothetical protein
MSLLDIRRHFIQITGRYDLIVDETTYANNGADAYIQAGQQWLDRRSDILKQEGVSYFTLTQGAWYKIIERVRVIDQLWLTVLGSDRLELKRTSLRTLREYFTQDPALITEGVPCEYALMPFRDIPEQVDETIVEQFLSNTYTEAVYHGGYVCVVFTPPVQAQSLLEVRGKFHQPKLTLDADINYWTEELPFVLTLAACRALEITYRNKAGVEDWEQAITNELAYLEFDLADQESSGITQIEG